MPRVTDKKEVETAEYGTLIPYYLTSESKKTPLLYNGVQVVGKTGTADAFGITGLPVE